MSKKKQSEIGFMLRAIETKQFAIYPDLYKSESDVMLLQKYDYGINKEERLLVVLTEYRFTQNEVPFLSIQVACHFEIEQNAWDAMANEDNSAAIVEPGLLGHLLVLTIGTTRGVLHAKTENTILNKYFLPTINVNEIVNENTILEFV